MAALTSKFTALLLSELPAVPGCCSGEHGHEKHDVSPPCATRRRAADLAKKLASEAANV